jgi:hypothetical protein
MSLMLGPPKSCRRDQPITVSLEDLVPASNFSAARKATLYPYL